MVPFAGRNVGLYDIASNGSVDHYLGLLAATCGRRVEAAAHLRRAVAFNDVSGQRPAAARSRTTLATVVDDPESVALISDATVAAEELGLAQLTAEIDRWRHTVREA